MFCLIGITNRLSIFSYVYKVNYNLPVDDLTLLLNGDLNAKITLNVREKCF